MYQGTQTDGSFEMVPTRIFFYIIMAYVLSYIILYACFLLFFQFIYVCAGSSILAATTGGQGTVRTQVVTLQDIQDLMSNPYDMRKEQGRAFHWLSFLA